MNEYRVIDLQTDVVDPTPKTVTANSPEKAAQLALGVELVRSGNRQDLRAKVYCQHPGQPTNMVRLYTKAANRQNGMRPTRAG